MDMIRESGFKLKTIQPSVSRRKRSLLNCTSTRENRVTGTEPNGMASVVQAILKVHLAGMVINFHETLLEYSYLPNLTKKSSV